MSQRNPRFLSHCPYCSTSGRETPSARLPNRPARSESANDLPPYSATASPAVEASPGSSPPPPPYTPTPNPSLSFLNQPPAAAAAASPKSNPGYIIHHLRHAPDPNADDTIVSLSLKYNLPASTLRSFNRLPADADYLLAARQTILIPISPSSSSSSLLTLQQPQESEEDAAERARKTAIRRWMVACKEPDYDAAVVYLSAHGYRLDDAVRQYRADGEWERTHPMPSSSSSSGSVSVRKNKIAGLLRGRKGGG